MGEYAVILYLFSTPDSGAPMHHTMFNTPVISHLLQAFSILVLKLAGWKVEGSFPENTPKAVLIAAPHTTNWDMPISLMMAFRLRLPVYWMGKKSIFKFPFAPVMRWMGGIPVERSKSTNMVDSIIERYQENDKLLIMIAPEGTRARVEGWKSGFYHMAKGADVPIVMAYIDYANKRGGIGPVFWPTGNYEKDLEEIQSFYQAFRGKYD